MCKKLERLCEGARVKGFTSPPSFRPAARVSLPSSAMDRYQKVEKPRREQPIGDNEIRITSQGAIRNYISYATTLLQDKRLKEIVLKAMGLAISKTVAIAEILKKRNPRLHQETAISSVSITDTWEPIEEGLVPVEMTRQVSMISITLSMKELNKASPGYQAPHRFDESKPQHNYERQQPAKEARAQYNDYSEDSYGYGQGRGRGRGRGGGRGWSRGGYGNYQDTGEYANWNRGGGRGWSRGGYGNYQDSGEYTNWNRGGGRGRGWNNQDNGEYVNRNRGGGRGRGWDNQDDGGNYNQGRGGGRGRGWDNQDDGENYNRGRGGGRGRGWDNQDDGENYNWGRGGGRGRGWDYQSGGYDRGRGRSGRGYSGSRGRMGGRFRGGSY